MHQQFVGSGMPQSAESFPLHHNQAVPTAAGDVGNTSSTRRRPHSVAASRTDCQSGQSCLLDIIASLFKRDKKQFFWLPVDGSIVSDYYTIVQHPLDLTSMKQKVQDGAYCDFDSFQRDVFLIIDNCRLYNGKDTVYVKSADNLEAWWRKSSSRLRASYEAAVYGSSAARGRPSTGGGSSTLLAGYASSGDSTHSLRSEDRAAGNFNSSELQANLRGSPDSGIASNWPRWDAPAGQTAEGWLTQSPIPYGTSLGSPALGGVTAGQQIVVDVEDLSQVGSQVGPPSQTPAPPSLIAPAAAPPAPSPFGHRRTPQWPQQLPPYMLHEQYPDPHAATRPLQHYPYRDPLTADFRPRPQSLMGLYKGEGSGLPTWGSSGESASPYPHGKQSSERGAESLTLAEVVALPNGQEVLKTYITGAAAAADRSLWSYGSGHGSGWRRLWGGSTVAEHPTGSSGAGLLGNLEDALFSTTTVVFPPSRQPEQKQVTSSVYVWPTAVREDTAGAVLLPGK